jgi:hypothetical protein
VVVGYEGEPYLRFGDGGVYENVRSPATYRDDERYGSVDVPARADPKATPEWKRIAATNAWEWHDHRVHWMSPIDPPGVRNARDEKHHVLDWTVPLRSGTSRLAIVGSLDDAPPRERSSRVYPALFVLVALVVGGAIVGLRSTRGGRRGGA